MYNKSYVLENVIILILLKTNENKETRHFSKSHTNGKQPN